MLPDSLQRDRALDFEFISASGGLPVPGLHKSGPGAAHQQVDPTLARRAGLQEPPFPINDETLFVAYFASAELGCFLQLGWPMPTRVIDLLSEFRNATNGIALPAGRGLLSALSHHGICAITADQKTEERALSNAGRSVVSARTRPDPGLLPDQRDPLGRFEERMLPRIRAHPDG